MSVVKTNAEMSSSVNTPIPIYVIVINQRHRETDRQTNRGHYSASHGKMYANIVT